MLLNDFIFQGPSGLQCSSPSDSIFDTPKKARLRHKLRKKTLIALKQSRKLKILQQKMRRMQKRNVLFKNIIIKLKKERYINNDTANILSENVLAAELYNSLTEKMQGKKRPNPKYPPEFRKFCLTLHFYSPRAYSYVRRTFNTCLPHPKTIYNWYKAVDGSPGLTDEAFQILNTKVQCTKDKQLICALVADEMAIRPQNFRGGHGQVDIGNGTTDCSTKATEAYTFMLVCLNEPWKIPLGYFLIHSLTGDQKANLIKMCLSKCEEVGIKVVALTFDAHTTNISAMTLLGCRIEDPKNLKTTFKHPTADHDVAVFLDSNHMIKLVRNHFEGKKELIDLQKNKIKWEYLIKLNELQEKEGLHIANKLSRKHLEFRNCIMKVKLASQLLSRSVSIALQYCREVLKLKEFEDSEGTEKFILLFNNLFDIFNTRRLTQHGLSHPLSCNNKEEIYEFLDKATEYILNLEIKTTRKRKFKDNDKIVDLKICSFDSALKVRCSPGFKGLLISINSLKHIFSTLVEDTKELSYISTYRLSQDHIELLFGSIRMHGGHNDNPNAIQFKGAYRKLLSRMELQVGETGNCVPLEAISVLTCSSAIACINATSFSERFDDRDEEIIEYKTTDDDLEFDRTLEIYDEPDYKNHIVGYITGYVVRHIIKKIKCQFCIENMLSKEILWFHKLVNLRDKGGLIYASKAAYNICCISETSLRSCLKENLGENAEKKIVLRVMSKLIGISGFPASEYHINAQHHDTNLARLIVERYIKIRFFYEAKKNNISQIVSSKRQLLKKRLHFQGH